MEANILKRIFFDEHSHWERFKDKYGARIRPVVLKEIEKFRGCGDPENGFKLFVCEGCHHVRKVPYRCKGRFCTTCSVGESEEWSRLLSEDVLQVNHRHVIFTVDEGLRDIFLLHRHLLKIFMDEAARLLMDYFQKKIKVTPGIIVGLHTFGARINFNPHVHILVTMGGMTKTGEWKGFYVHAPKQKGNVKKQLQYIGRYIRRPAIGLNRIEEYDGQSVSFAYADKVDGRKKIETISVEEFISRLIRHIPDEQFKMIRHYGMYARRIKTLCKKLLNEWQKKARRWIIKVKKTLRRQTWRERVIASGKKDPLLCPKCESFYEYKGEVCLESGEWQIKVALCQNTRNYLKRVIDYFASKQTSKKEKEEKHSWA